MTTIREDTSPRLRVFSPSMSHARIGRNSALIQRLARVNQSNQIVCTSSKVNTKSYATTTQERPLRVGIIGSGPAGFYAASRILKKLQDARVDMYEQLPAPFGLVRYGVAPDHPEVKNCQDKFEEVAESTRFKFIGNVQISHDVSLKALVPFYDALLFSYGAAKDRLLGIPGEELDGVLSARAFVGWYNGLPEYDNLRPKLDGDTAYVVGNGNVALDVARVLLSGVDALRTTDISGQALDALSKSEVKRVVVCGRRGPMQAAFTIKEVRELMNLRDVGFTPIDPHLLPTTQYISALPRLEQRKYRLANLLARGSANPVENSDKSWSLMSLVSTASFHAEGDTNRLGSISMTKTAYCDENSRFEHDAKTMPTDEIVSFPTSLAFRSIGYKSVALPGLKTDLGVSFNDKSGIIVNDGSGRAVSRTDNKIVPGCYCAGWVKRGPTGVIASTMEDAFASADAIIMDWIEGVRFLNGTRQDAPQGIGTGWDGIMEEMQNSERQQLRPVSWEDWKKIDAAEVQRGRSEGKPREKFRSQAEMLHVLD